MKRREYGIQMIVNSRWISKVIIDPHYEAKHQESITDEIIIQLVKTLNGEAMEPDEQSPPFSYFVTDKIELGGKLYKLVWLLEADEIYIGVINAYRRG